MHENKTVAEDDQELEFKYTSAHQAPEVHRTIAIQYAMGADVMMIAGSVGYDIGYVEKILRHPPLHEIISGVRESLDREVVSQLQDWTGMLPKAIAALKASLESKNERVKLAAATEYLDRHPSGVFIKRKTVDASTTKKVMDTSSIEELKRNAVKAEGVPNVRAITGPNESAGVEDAARRTESADDTGERDPGIAGGVESGPGIRTTHESAEYRAAIGEDAGGGTVSSTGRADDRGAGRPADPGARSSGRTESAERRNSDDPEAGRGDRDGSSGNSARDALDEYDPL